jgi:hypothetical protein
LPNVTRLFDLQPGEGRSVGLMLGHSFAMGAATVFFETAASALFLARFGAGALPYVYIAAAVLNTATGAVYARVQDRVPFARLMTGTLWFLLVSVAALRVGLGLGAAAWLIFLLLVWYRALSILTDLEYWAVAARLYDVRQAKRLFGIVGSGEVVARIAGSFAVPLIVHAFGVASLVLLSAVALAVCLALASFVLRALPKTAETSPAGSVPVSRPGLVGLLRDPYLRVIILLAFFGVLAKYLVDFAFLAQMRTRYADAQNLATFFALFSGFSQVASLLTRVFVSGRLLSRFGVRVGLTVLPAAHVACTALIVASGLLPGEAGLVFWLVISNQAIYKTLKHPIDNPSFKVLYQPLRKDQRLATQITVETLVTPLTIGLAGGLMLLFSKVVPFDPVVFAWVMLAAFGGWVIMAKGAGRQYAAALVHALKRRFLDDDDPFNYDDARSLAVLHNTLGSDRPEDVLFALELLEKARVPGLEPAVIRLADHPSADVRQAALRRLQDWETPAARARVRARAKADPVPAVRAVALRAACRHAGSEGMALAVAALDDASPEVRRGAMVGLLGIGHDAARDRLARLAASPSPADRAWSARVAGDAAHPESAATLVALLADPSPVVRRAAVAAAGRARDRTLWPSVAEALGDRRLRGAAAAALVIGGTGCGRRRRPLSRRRRRRIRRPRGRARAGARRRSPRAGRAPDPPRVPRSDRAPRGARVPAPLALCPGLRRRGSGRPPPPARPGARPRGLDAGRPARPAAGTGLRGPERGPRPRAGPQPSGRPAPALVRQRPRGHLARARGARAWDEGEACLRARGPRRHACRRPQAARARAAGGSGREGDVRAPRGEPRPRATAGRGAGEGSGAAAARVRLGLDHRVRAVRGGTPGGRGRGRRAGRGRR